MLKRTSRKIKLKSIIVQDMHRYFLIAPTASSPKFGAEYSEELGINTTIYSSTLHYVAVVVLSYATASHQ